MHLVVRRSLQTVLVTGGLAATAAQLAGTAAAVAVAVVSVAAAPVVARPYRWPTSRRPSSLTEVPTQRSAPPES
jgi:hypothetical protein